MKTTHIKQTVTFQAKPEEIYDLLMNSKKHAEFTGGKATVSAVVGGRVKAYDGYIEAKNVGLLPGKKIVQEWRAADWPSEAWSLVKFELEKTKTGTKLTFTQTGVPEEFVDEISSGWKEYYWLPMKAWLAAHT